MLLRLSDWRFTPSFSRLTFFSRVILLPVCPFLIGNQNHVIVVSGAFRCISLHLKWSRKRYFTHVSRDIDKRSTKVHRKHGLDLSHFQDCHDKSVEISSKISGGSNDFKLYGHTRNSNFVQRPSWNLCDSFSPEC